MDCIFCKVANKESPSQTVYEDEQVLAFKDVQPLAPVHILIIPKRHIKSIVDLTDKDTELMGKMILIAKEIADDFGISENGYKLLLRVGQDGGQVIEHIHLHLIGGAPLSEGIHPI